MFDILIFLNSSQERALSYDCIELNRYDKSVDCTAYFENFKMCKKFWNAVQEYRCMHMKKTRNDYPKDKELDMWKSQLPEWIRTQKLKSIEDLNEEK